jgi:hypothetical protein
LPHVCADLRRTNLADAWEAYRAAWRSEAVQDAMRGAVGDESRHAEANTWKMFSVAEV